MCLEEEEEGGKARVSSRQRGRPWAVKGVGKVSSVLMREKEYSGSSVVGAFKGRDFRGGPGGDFNRIFTTET